MRTFRGKHGVLSLPGAGPPPPRPPFPLFSSLQGLIDTTSHLGVFAGRVIPCDQRLSLGEALIIPIATGSAKAQRAARARPVFFANVRCFLAGHARISRTRRLKSDPVTPEVHR